MTLLFRLVFLESRVYLELLVGHDERVERQAKGLLGLAGYRSSPLLRLSYRIQSCRPTTNKHHHHRLWKPSLCSGGRSRPGTVVRC